MENHVRVADLAARLEIDLPRVEAIARGLGLRVVEARGGRALRLRDAGRIVRAIDPIGRPREAGTDA